MTRTQFNEKAFSFLEKAFSILDKHKIEVSSFDLDHICWRVDSIFEFKKMESTLLQFGTLFHKSIHNGRPISLIQLLQPIIYEGRKISIIELPAPKEGKSYANGFEHLEFVVASNFPKLHSNYPDLQWDTSNINKAINPDVKLKFENLTVKFHPYSLAHVVKYLE